MKAFTQSLLDEHEEWLEPIERIRILNVGASLALALFVP